jgi:hypothetical protein
MGCIESKPATAAAAAPGGGMTTRAHPLFLSGFFIVSFFLTDASKKSVRLSDFRPNKVIGDFLRAVPLLGSSSHAYQSFHKLETYLFCWFNASLQPIN